MLKLFILFNLINLSLTDFIGYCENIFDMDTCIESIYCGWCNVTNYYNNTYVTKESCIFKNTCITNFNDTNCIINPNNYQICNFTISAINLLLIILYIAIAYTLISTSKNFYNPEEHPKYACFIDFFLTSFVFVPSFTLWFINSSYFLPYLLALLTFTFIFFLISSGYRYRQRRNLRYTGYHQINGSLE